MVTREWENYQKIAEGLRNNSYFGTRGFSYKADKDGTYKEPVVHKGRK